MPFSPSRSILYFQTFGKLFPLSDKNSCLYDMALALILQCTHL